MPFGVTDLFGLTAPTVGYVHDSSRSKSIEVSTVRDQQGVTRCVMPQPLVTVEVNISGKGDIPIGTFPTLAELIAEGEIQITSQKRTENNNAYPDFEVTGKMYEALTPGDPEPVPGTPNVEPATNPACPVIGIKSVGYAGIQTYELEEVIEESDVVLSPGGTFEHQHFYDPMINFSMSGLGDFPAILSLGGNGGLSFAGGVTVISEVSESQTNTGEPSWDASGVHYPNAA